MSEPDERLTWLEDAAQQARECIASLYQEGMDSLDQTSRGNHSAAPPTMTSTDPTAVAAETPNADTDTDQLGGTS